MTDTTDTTTTPLSPADQRRETLRQRIEDSGVRKEARKLADQARDAADGFVDYAKRNPLKVVGGAIAAGLLIGAVSRPGRRLGKRAGKRGGALAAVALDAALAYGLKAWDNAGTAAKHLGDTSTSTADRWSKRANYSLDVANDAVRDGTRKASAIGKKAMRDMRNRFTH